MMSNRFRLQIFGDATRVDENATTEQSFEFEGHHSTTIP